MMRVKDLLLEEPVLNGSTGYRTKHQALLSLDDRSDTHHSRQLGNRLLLKQLLRGEPQTCLIRSGNNLNAEDRIPTQFKKVIVNANPLQPKHFSPDASENTLCCGAWSHEGPCCKEPSHVRRG